MITNTLRRLFRPKASNTPEPAAIEQAAPAQPTPATSTPEADPLALLLPFQVRPLMPDDLPALLTIFRQAIQVGSANDYTQQERNAWSQAQSQAGLISALSEGEVVVAEWESKLVGFAHRVADYLNMIYVHPDSSRLGIATLLYQHLEDGARIEGQARLTTHASKTATPFFEYMGFALETAEAVERNGVALARNIMAKPLR